MEGDPAEIVPQIDLVSAVDIVAHRLQDDDLNWPLLAHISHDGVGKLGERGGTYVASHSLSVFVHHEENVAFGKVFEERSENPGILVDKSILWDRSRVVDYFVPASCPVI